MNNLRLIRPPKQPQPAAPVPIPPVVLNQSAVQRLAALNEATRELRDMGLHVIWSKLAGQVPQAHIRRDGDISMTPLMDRMGPRSFHHDAGCTVVSGEFMGVLVSWIEPNPQ